jgi:hypothetical protein
VAMVRRYYATYRVRRAERHFDISAEGLCLRDMPPVELAQNLDELYEEMFKRGIVPVAARQIPSEIGETLRFEVDDEMVIDHTNTVAKTTGGWILR